MAAPKMLGMCKLSAELWNAKHGQNRENRKITPNLPSSPPYSSGLGRRFQKADGSFFGLEPPYQMEQKVLP